MNPLTARQVADKLQLTYRAFASFKARTKDFPQPIKMSARTLRWDEADIDQWLATKKENANERTQTG